MGKGLNTILEIVSMKVSNFHQDNGGELEEKSMSFFNTYLREVSGTLL